MSFLVRVQGLLQFTSDYNHRKKTQPACPKVYTLLLQRRLVSGLTNSKTLKNEKKKKNGMNEIKDILSGYGPLCLFYDGKAVCHEYIFVPLNGIRYICDY